MDLELNHKVVVVTAGSKGIGRAVAETFAREGARIVLNARSEDTLARVATEIREGTGAEVVVVPGDVSQPDDCRHIVDQAVQHFGRLDVLFVNAGGPPSKRFEDTTDEDWQRAFETNLLSAVRLIRAAVPHLRQTRGAVVTLTSYAVKQPLPGLVLSNSIRPGVAGLVKTLATELAPDGIRLNNVGPGIILTERQEYLQATRARNTGQSVEEVMRQTEATIPLGRFGRPEDVANMVVFLASPASGFVTGSTILVDGGSYAGLL